VFGDLGAGDVGLVTIEELTATGPDLAFGIGLDYILHVITGGVGTG